MSAQASCHPWLTEPGTQIGEGIFTMGLPGIWNSEESYGEGREEEVLLQVPVSVGH